MIFKEQSNRSHFENEYVYIALVSKKGGEITIRCVYPGLQMAEQPDDTIKPTFNLDDRPQEDIHEELCRDLQQFRIKHQKLPLFSNDFTKLNMKENLMKCSIQRIGEEHNSKIFIN